MNSRYGSLGSYPVDRDQERLLRELHVERAPVVPADGRSRARRAPLLRLWSATVHLLRPRASLLH